VVAFLNREVFPDIPKGTAELKFVGKVGDEYNTGSWRRGTPPKKYIADLLAHYQKPAAELRAAFS